MGVLIAYFMLSIEIYLATYCLAVFRLSFWGMGPTELRILLAIGTLALIRDPHVDDAGPEPSVCSTSAEPWRSRPRRSRCWSP